MSLVDNSGQSQRGGSNNTQIIGIDQETFVSEMKRKDDRIDQLIAEKEALSQKIAEFQKKELQAEIALLKEQKQVLVERLSKPEQSFQEHASRASQVASILDDVATRNAIGENRIRSALEAYNELDYEEIDAILAETEELGIAQAAKSAYGRGLIAEDAIRWHDAAKHYARAARLQESVESLYKAREFAWRINKLDEAEFYGTSLLHLARAHSDEKWLAIALNEHGLTNKALGQYLEAEQCYREAIEIDERTLEEFDPDKASRLNNLGVVLHRQGKLSEAEVWLRKALDIIEKNFGREHTHFALDMGNLADVLTELGQLEEAEAAYVEALDISARVDGTGHPFYALSLGRLGLFYSENGRKDSARELLIQALDILKQSLPAGHPHIVETLRRLRSVEE